MWGIKPFLNHDSDTSPLIQPLSVFLNVHPEGPPFAQLSCIPLLLYKTQGHMKSPAGDPQTRTEYMALPQVGVSKYESFSDFEKNLFFLLGSVLQPVSSQLNVLLAASSARNMSFSWNVLWTSSKKFVVTSSDKFLHELGWALLPFSCVSDQSISFWIWASNLHLGCCPWKQFFCSGCPDSFLSSTWLLLAHKISTIVMKFAGL